MCTHYYNAILDDSLSVVADNFLYPHQLPTKVCEKYFKLYARPTSTSFLPSFICTRSWHAIEEEDFNIVMVNCVFRKFTT